LWAGAESLNKILGRNKVLPSYGEPERKQIGNPHMAIGDLLFNHTPLLNLLRSNDNIRIVRSPFFELTIEPLPIYQYRLALKQLDLTGLL
jgi:hypothetical protein